MSLKTRILLSSAGMVLISLMVMMLVGGNVIHLFSRGERVDVVRADEALAAASALLEEYDGGEEDLENLAANLRKHGYRLAALKEGDVTYSNFPAERGEMLERAGQIPWNDVPGAVSVWGENLVGRKVSGITLVAVSMVRPGPRFNGMPPILLSFLVNGVIAIIPILLCSQIFTNRVSNTITRPLAELSEAARRIERGDLTQPVLIRGQNEFAEVCETFNNMQQHLLAEREKNAAYEKARTDLVSGISHDLRTPLTSVKGYIKGLRDGVAATPEKQDQYLQIAYERACDMEKLIARLLDFSRLECGRIPMEFRPVDLGTFAEEFADMLREEYRPGDVSIETNIEPGEHPVSIDEAQMRRVLTNLTDNAVKYAGVLPLKLKISVFSAGKQVCLHFADNGVGVAESQLAHIFEQFWRGDASRSTQGAEGSGLGLYIVKYIAEAHGGSVGARKDGGLVIEISLPVREEKHEDTDC